MENSQLVQFQCLVEQNLMTVSKCYCGKYSQNTLNIQGFGRSLEPPQAILCMCRAKIDNDQWVIFDQSKCETLNIRCLVEQN